MLLWFLLFVVTCGSVAVVTLNGRAGTCRLLFGQFILGGRFALLPEDALRRSCPITLLVFCQRFVIFKVAAFNLSSSDWRHILRSEVDLLAVSWISLPRTGLSAGRSLATTCATR